MALVIAHECFGLHTFPERSLLLRSVSPVPADAQEFPQRPKRSTSGWNMCGMLFAADGLFRENTLGAFQLNAVQSP